MMSIWLAVTGLRFPEDLLNQTLSWMLLLLSLACGSIYAARLRDFGKVRIGQWFWWTAIILLVGAGLEISGPMKGLSDAFREVVYSDGLYTNDARDLANVGYVRPKLFTSEPSHLAKFFLLCVVISSLAKGKIFRHLVLLFFGFAILGSSTVLLGLPILVAIGVSKGLKTKRYRQVALLGGPIGFALALALGIWAVFDRLGFGGNTIEASAFMRVVRPFLIAQLAFWEHPFVGFGMGSEALLSQQNKLASFAFRDQLYAQSQVSDGSGVVWGSVHFAILPQLGAIGTIAWLLILDALRAKLGTKRGIFWTFYATYGIAVGSLNTPLFIVPLLSVAYLGCWVVPSENNGKLLKQPTAL